ncbi:MAG: dTDP-4-dehydrorhamnose reductase [bacterium]|nr:dTDP-4-dehydrorhamnose reductase [bacterium]
MRVCIVGARGMLGHALVRAFSDCEVIAWDRSNLDITNAVQVRARIAAAAPEILINAAAYNAVDRAEEEQAVADAVNGYAVGHLADAAAAVGAAFVHYSTDYVFGALQDLPPLPPLPAGGGIGAGYAEDAIPDPCSAYGRSKFLGEQEVQRVAAAHPGWQWHIIRLSRLFGTAAQSAGGKRSFVDVIIERAAASDRLEVVDDERASPTYAPDLAQATRDLVARTTESGIYHRTNDGACTWYRFAQEALTCAGWRGTLVPVSASQFPRAARRPTHSVLRTTKLPPLRGWEQALAEYLGHR